MNITMHDYYLNAPFNFPKKYYQTLSCQSAAVTLWAPKVNARTIVYYRILYNTFYCVIQSTPSSALCLPLGG